MTSQQSWLPNLVAGVSIWKLAVDLNAPGFMDGRLLEPETEGNDSLPSSVSWDLTGLVPLAEARRDHAEAADKAIAEFFACLERVRAQFDDPESGYHQYREAFTLPAIDSDEDHYFFSAERGRVYVINWGASPRTMQQDQAYLFGYQGFEDLYKQVGVAPVAVVAGAGAAAAAAGDSKAAASKEDNKKDADKKKPEADERRWWMWALLIAAAVAIVILLLFLMQNCEDTAVDGADAGTDSALAGGGGSGGGDAGKPGAGGGNSGAGGGAAAGGHSGSGDMAAGGSGGGAAGHGAAGHGAGGDGAGVDGAGGDGAGGDGAGANGQGGSSGNSSGGGSGNSGSAGSSGGVSGGGGVVVIDDSSGAGGDIIAIRPEDLAASGQAHRSHSHPNAKAWQVSSGRQYVDRTVLVGRQYHVVLKRGARFEQIRVQWRDSQGIWHDH